MASDALTPETAMDLLYPLLDDSKSVSLDDILAAWERDRARLAEVTAALDHAMVAAELGVFTDAHDPAMAIHTLQCQAQDIAIAAERSATMDSACPECFPDNDYGLRIEGFVCVYRLPHRSSSPNSLTAIAAERGKGEG